MLGRAATRIELKIEEDIKEHEEFQRILQIRKEERNLSSNPGVF